MHYRHLFVFLILFTAAHIPLSAQEMPPGMERIRQVCKAFADGDMKTLQAQSSPDMKKAIDNGSMSLAVLQTSTLFGKLLSLENFPEKLRTVNGITTYAQKVKFERKNLICLIRIDSADKVCGIHFIPWEQKEEKKEPEKTTGLREREIKVGKTWPILPGTLTLPSGKPPFPAVILIHGSGPLDRDATIYGNKPFRDLAEMLAKRNIAVLRYDKRTFVHPEEIRKQKSVTVDDETVEDALKALDTLRNMPEISPEKIWFLGHSLGGMMLPRIASKTTAPAGYIFMAAPARSMPDVLEEQGIYLLNQNRILPDAEKKKALELLQKQTETLKNPTETKIPGQQYAYWKDLSSYDQGKEARKMKCPLLFLQGKRDFQVLPQHLELWKKTLKDHPGCKFILYEGLNHLMLPGKGPGNMAEYATPSKVPRKVADDIAAFIGQTGAP